MSQRISLKTDHSPVVVYLVTYCIGWNSKQSSQQFPLNLWQVAHKWPRKVSDYNPSFEKLKLLRIFAYSFGYFLKDQLTRLVPHCQVISSDKCH